MERPMPELVRVLTADRGDAGRRLDVMIRRHLSNLSAATRSRVQRWIAGGLVSVNGTPVTRVAARTTMGDVVQVSVPAADRPAPMEPEDSPLSVIFEDDHLLAVNKPAGLVVHPTYRHTRGTVMNALLGYARAWPEGQRPSLVGRLDKGTSGLLLVAKTSSVHRALQQAGEAGTIRKEYLALVLGAVRTMATIDLPLSRDPHDRRRVVVAPAGARSVTKVHPLAMGGIDGGAVSLLHCVLVTGRTHQIRVHLAARGWPIVGDETYGPRPASAGAGALLSRQALHAWGMTFEHPVTAGRVALGAPLPADLQGVLPLVGIGCSLDFTGTFGLP
jgi:23S rRNA pseudouridine1911/1915/1917 synthase